MDERLVPRGQEDIETVRKMYLRIQRLERAVRWALGELGDFPGRERGPREGAFWWREELRKRAGLRWDHKRMRYVPTRRVHSATVCTTTGDQP